MTRRDLALHFAAQGYTRGVEVGVERGKFSEVLCQCIPGLQLVAVDTWCSRPGYREHVTPELWAEIEQDCRRRLRPYGALVVKADSVAVAADFPDNFFDFVYIDADHSEEAVCADVEHWMPKVREGGVVSGHDAHLPGVKTAIWWLLEKQGEVRYTDERSPSFWWVKSWQS